MAERTWQLFLDESGDFTPTGAPSCVAGLLVDETHQALPVATLREALRRVCPLVPYPPHATELRKGSGLLAAWLVHGPPPADPRVPTALFEYAANHVRRCESAACRGFASAVAAACIPPFRVIADFDAELQRHAPAIWSGLNSQARVVAQRMDSLLGAVGRVWRDGCVVIGVSAQPTDPDRDPYLCALETLFERLLALLRNGAEEVHRVCIRPGSRGLTPHRPDLDIDIRRDHIQSCIDVAVRFPWLPAAKGSVQLEALRPEDFDEHVHPGIVLADAVCNRLFPRLRETSWEALERGFGARVTLPLKSMCQSISQTLPALAADGQYRNAIAAALRGEPIVGAVLPRTWMRDQAERWIDASRLLPGARR